MEVQKRRYNIRSLIKFLQGVVFAIFIFAIIFIIYLISIYHTRLTPFVNYAIVFDAGSSHTEMFVYYWPADKSNGLGTTSTVNELFVCQLNTIRYKDPIKGETTKLKAISDFEKNLDKLEDYFRPCLTEAIERIPANRYKFSPIFLGATAGMRLLNMRNVKAGRQILETIRDIFSRSPFQFVVARQVRILTGIEEAIDGWITTNVLLEKITHRHAKKKIQPKNELDADMIGVLDLGGASTQVTFTYNKTINNEPVPDKFSANISLFGNTYNPYAHSYLCWGKNEGLKRHRARLLTAAINTNPKIFSNSASPSIDDPCFVPGFNQTLPLTQIFSSPCTVNEKQKFINYINKAPLTFVGTGNYSQCRQLLINLFDTKRNDKKFNCSYKQEYCTFDHAFQPYIPSNIRFIGLSGYYYVFNSLAFGMSKTKNISLERYDFKDFPQEEFAQRLNNVCETEYSILYEQEQMNSSTEVYKRNLCFDATYIWLLLTYGIGFKGDDLKRLSVAQNLPSGKVGWTLGYMINQTNYIPAEYRERIITKKSFVGWLISSLIIATIALIFLLFTSYLFCRRKQLIKTTTINNKDELPQINEQEAT